MRDSRFPVLAMPRSHALGWLLVLGGLASPPEARSAAPITARAMVPSGDYYVGQEIPLRVLVLGLEAETVTIEPPMLSEAEIHRVEKPDEDEKSADSAQPRVFPFRVIARRPGKLVIPSLWVEAGDRSARTAPVVLSVLPLPAAGRTAAFRGGVGDLEVAAVAMPSALKVGQTLEYRLQLRGPGALGSSQAPTLQGIDGDAVRVEPLPMQADLAAQVPTRTFRWRLRPLRPGRWVVPPQRLSVFDPTSRRYLTRPSSSVTVAVEDVPAFDPSTIDYPAPMVPERRGAGKGLLAVTAVLALVFVGLLIGGFGWSRHRRHDRRRDPRALAARLAREFDRLGKGSDRDPQKMARCIAGSLADYLAAAWGRPPGALTPLEAREGFGQDEAVADLAEQAGRLLERCDWICFADPRDVDVPAEESGMLAQQAASLFARLARTRALRLGPKKPREAPGSATA